MSDNFNIIFIGDIVGQAGLDIVLKYLPDLKEKYSPDLIIANGENADKGKGITKKEAKILFDNGINVITTGNHIWDNWYSKPLLKENPKVLRPYNYPHGNIGKGFYIHEFDNGESICIINIQGRTFMQAIDCPFKAMDNILKNISERTKNIIVDFHADATAEKIAMGWYLDGKVSALIGTHTHIPTSDASILPQGTAYITDVGMTGPYDSVVGMNKEIALKRFTLQIPHKYEVAKKDGRLCAVNLNINAFSGLANSIKQIILPKFENGL